MAIIKTDTKEAIITAVNRDLGASVQIYQMCTHFNRKGDKTVKVGVNWAALGTTTPEETREFSKILETAANICEAINGLELTEKWGSDYETNEDYYKDVRFIIEGLNGGQDIKKLIEMII